MYSKTAPQARRRERVTELKGTLSTKEVPLHSYILFLNLISAPRVWTDVFIIKMFNSGPMLHTLRACTAHKASSVQESTKNLGS